MRRFARLVIGLTVFGGCASACGEPDPSSVSPVLDVAVAANFAPVHAALAERFTERTGVEVRTTVGSTGHLYAQIRNGAPFDVFLAADSARPRRLEREGYAAPGSRVTYAHGRLALLRRDRPGDVGVDALHGDGLLAIADPRTAPYGAAALEAIGRLGAREAVADRLVRTPNVGQTVQLVRSGAVELGFVPLSHALDEPGSRVWRVPDSLHVPIVQQAIRLRDADAPDPARRYLDFLTGDEARRRITAAGYALPVRANR